MQGCYVVQVTGGVACPVVVGLLRTVGSVVLFFKVLGSIQAVMSSRQLDMSLVSRRDFRSHHKVDAV